MDMKKEMRKLCYRGNSLVRKFSFCGEDVKCTLFRSFCYSLYCASLWSNYKNETYQRLRVNYNNIMRRLMGVPLYSSASFLFGSNGVKTLNELIRTSQYSIMKRIETSPNTLIQLLHRSDIMQKSNIIQRWHNSLFLWLSVYTYVKFE